MIHCSRGVDHLSGSHRVTLGPLDQQRDILVQSGLWLLWLFVCFFVFLVSVRVPFLKIWKKRERLLDYTSWHKPQSQNLIMFWSATKLRIPLRSLLYLHLNSFCPWVQQTSPLYFLKTRAWMRVIKTRVKRHTIQTKVFVNIKVWDVFLWRNDTHFSCHAWRIEMCLQWKSDRTVVVIIIIIKSLAGRRIVWNIKQMLLQYSNNNTRNQLQTAN